MDKKTAKSLNQINKEFYLNISKEFHESRKYSWDGWDILANYVDLSQISTVLDVGCGNGRFAKFLFESGNKEFNYTGIDSNQQLLDNAKDSLMALDLDFNLIKKDFIEDPNSLLKISEHKFDLVVAFGVLHHIPGFKNRKTFLNNLLNVKKKEGFVVFSIWNFSNNPRFKKKIVKDSNFPNYLDKKDLDDGDYFLNWGDNFKHLRYCHDVDSDELGKLLDVEPQNEWLADKFNRYILI